MATTEEREREFLSLKLMYAMRDERARQIAKFGAQHETPSMPPEGSDVALDGGGPSLLICNEQECKDACNQAFFEGQGSWAHIAVEELAEAICAPDEQARREELVQLATVCMGWIEAIDARAACEDAEQGAR